MAERIEGLQGCFVIKSREPKEMALALRRALAFEGRTNGRQRILDLELTNEQVAKRIMEVYEGVMFNV